MARRKSVVDDLLVLPWWFNVILAGIVYFAFKHWLPSIQYENPIFKGMAPVLLSLANLLAGLLLFIAFASAFNSWRKGTLLESQRGLETLRGISWREFEELVGEAYRRRGYAVAETGGGGADGGVDLVLSKGGERLLVQCKHWKTWKVSVKVVRELFGVVSSERATGGILISSGTYTQEAKAFAKANGIELVDGSQLMRLIAEVQRNPKVVASVEKSNLCPICGAEMVLRTARKGANAGNKFWGCSTYPGCRGTRPYGG